MTEQWTVETLRQHCESVTRERDARYAHQFESIEAVIVAQQRELHSAIQAMERHMQRSEEVQERRFESVNTARRVGDDLSRQMMPRAEGVQRDAALDEKIMALASRMDRTEGRSRGLNAGWAYLIAAIGMLASIVTAVYAISRLAAASTP